MYYTRNHHVIKWTKLENRYITFLISFTTRMNTEIQKFQEFDNLVEMSRRSLFLCPYISAC